MSIHDTGGVSYAVELDPAKLLGFGELAAAGADEPTLPGALDAAHIAQDAARRGAGLVHEAAHHLLFGLAADEPLVENELDERFDSPLRPDPRPKVGIFHATFAWARVHYACERLLDTHLSPADTRRIQARLADERRAFRGGYETVRCHGRLTATGDRLLSAAHAYMQQAVPRPHVGFHSPTACIAAA